MKLDSSQSVIDREICMLKVKYSSDFGSEADGVAGGGGKAREVGD